MLVLDRYPRQKIVIETSDGPVTITMVCIRNAGIAGERARLGIDAPQECNIYRQELGPKAYVEAAKGEA